MEEYYVLMSQLPLHTAFKAFVGLTVYFQNYITLYEGFVSSVSTHI
jgi:hypothetical protein